MLTRMVGPESSTGTTNRFILRVFVSGEHGQYTKALPTGRAFVFSSSGNYFHQVSGTSSRSFFQLLILSKAIILGASPALGNTMVWTVPLSPRVSTLTLMLLFAASQVPAVSSKLSSFLLKLMAPSLPVFSICVLSKWSLFVHTALSAINSVKSRVPPAARHAQLRHCRLLDFIRFNSRGDSPFVRVPKTK